jgi:hypothetical protein
LGAKGRRRRPTNREIPDRLVLSVRTVAGHIDRILGEAAAAYTHAARHDSIPIAASPRHPSPGAAPASVTPTPCTPHTSLFPAFVDADTVAVASRRAMSTKAHVAYLSFSTAQSQGPASRVRHATSVHRAVSHERRASQSSGNSKTRWLWQSQPSARQAQAHGACGAWGECQACRRSAIGAASGRAEVAARGQPGVHSDQHDQLGRLMGVVMIRRRMPKAISITGTLIVVRVMPASCTFA